MNKLKFIWASSKVEVIIAIALSLTAMFWVGATNGEASFQASDMDNWYAEWIDPVITIATLLIALFVWLNSKVHDWKDNLPKKLNSHFLYQGKYVISCFHANLIGEHDIRALAQQIGAQINKGAWLKFSPMANPSEPSIKKTKKGDFYRLYSIQFELDELPANALEKYLIWVVDRDDISMIEKKEIEGHPTSVYSHNKNGNA